MLGKFADSVKPEKQTWGGLSPEHFSPTVAVSALNLAVATEKDQCGIPQPPLVARPSFPEAGPVRVSKPGWVQDAGGFWVLLLRSFTALGKIQFSTKWSVSLLGL